LLGQQPFHGQLQHLPPGPPAVIGDNEVVADRQREGEHAAGLDVVGVGAEVAIRERRYSSRRLSTRRRVFATDWSRRAQSRTARSIGSSSLEKVSMPAFAVAASNSQLAAAIAHAPLADGPANAPNAIRHITPLALAG
jgi:hypothetical protein